jgi:hypothetical protein
MRSHIIPATALMAAFVIGCMKSPNPATVQQAQGQPQPVQEPALRVQFLSMTNDPTGTKLARFKLRNIGTEPLDVSFPGFVDVGFRGGGYFGFTNSTIRPGASIETSVEAPSSHSRWRAEFLCSIPSNSMQKFKSVQANHGLPAVRVGQVAISVYSEYLPPNGQDSIQRSAARVGGCQKV